MFERTYLEVNDIRQGMFLQSKDTGSPVLLILHGGPGSPEISFELQYPTGLDDLFTVCWWEQRGSGISYHSDIPRDTMTVEQMIDDTLIVVDYLRERFNKEKIYLMGHSWGSLLGVLTVQRAPELFHAYIGTGQVARQAESEKLAYSYMLEQFRNAGNKKMVRRLENIPIDKGAPVDIRYLGTRTAGMTKLGVGIMHQWTSLTKAVMIVVRCKEYSWSEKMRYAKGGSLSLSCLWDAVAQSDLFEQVPRLETPVYVLQGIFDYQVSYALAKEYLQAVEAPLKGFYTFENSAHSPCFEEPEKMCRILSEDVLQGKIELADRLKPSTNRETL